MDSAAERRFTSTCPSRLLSNQSSYCCLRWTSFSLRRRGTGRCYPGWGPTCTQLGLHAPNQLVLPQCARVPRELCRANALIYIYIATSHYRCHKREGYCSFASTTPYWHFTCRRSHAAPPAAPERGRSTWPFAPQGPTAVPDLAGLMPPHRLEGFLRAKSRHTRPLLQGSPCKTPP